MKNLSTLSVDGLDNLHQINIAHTDFTNFESLLNLKSLKKVIVSNGQLNDEITGALEEKGVSIEYVE